MTRTSRSSRSFSFAFVATLSLVSPSAFANLAPLPYAAAVAPITLPTNSVHLDGTKSKDPDGTIVSYLWTKKSGPAGGSFNNAAQQNPTFSGLVAGTYVFQIQATDNNGASATDFTNVVVNPAPSGGTTTSTICGLSNEWVYPGPVPGSVTLTCPSGQTVKSLQFASYGTPTGSCSTGFVAGTCDAAVTDANVLSLCQGKSTCVIDNFKGRFGDPCQGYGKELAVVATCSGSSTPPPSSGTVAELIIIQGESNASGRALNSPATATELSVQSGVQILNNSTRQFESLHIGVNNSIDQNVPDGTTTHGMELGLANAVRAGTLHGPVYLVKIGFAGAKVVDWIPGGSHYTHYLPYVDSAIAILNSRGIKFRITVWQSLGINDFFSGTSAANFKTMLQQFNAGFRGRYGATIPILSTNFQNTQGPIYFEPYLSQVYGAIASSDPNFFSIPVEGATYVDSAIHYDYNGFKSVVVKNMLSRMTQYWSTH